jgi:hypothetical protein
MENKGEFQSYLVNFATTGDPNVGNQVNIHWDPFGDTGSVLEIRGLQKFEMVGDTEVPADRCGFWQSAPYCTTCPTT